jgi:putative transposase
MGDRASLAEAAIRTSAREQGAVIHAIGLMPDHIHVAVSFPARFAIADLVKAFKGGSSHLLNHTPGLSDSPHFAWQAEYGALSFGKRSLSTVVAYVANQPDHHATNKLWPTFEFTERPYPQRTEIDD